MITISLAVTSKVVSHLCDSPTKDQRQIAIKSAGLKIREALSNATKNRTLTVCIGKRLTLTVGDTDAIWRAHNKACENEFDCLFDILALRPDEPMLFICELAP